MLSAESYADFLDDVRYIDDWDLWKGIELYGYDPGTSSAVTGMEDKVPKAALQRFATNEVGPLRVVVIALDDMDNSLVFVPHEPIPVIARLIEASGGRWAREHARRKYSALRIARIETMFSLSLEDE